MQPAGDREPAESASTHARRSAAGPAANTHRTVLDSREPFHYDAQRWGEYVQLSDSLFTFSHSSESILEEEQ